MLIPVGDFMVRKRPWRKLGGLWIGRPKPENDFGGGEGGGMKRTTAHLILAGLGLIGVVFGEKAWGIWLIMVAMNIGFAAAHTWLFFREEKETK